MQLYNIVLSMLFAFVMFPTSWQQEEQPDQPLVTCFRCLADRPSCGTVCQGLYCYKSELIIGENDRVVKRGCVNSTDSAARLGVCTNKEFKLPGSTTVSTEKFCICKEHKCNTSHSPLSIWGIVITLLLAMSHVECLIIPFF